MEEERVVEKAEVVETEAAASAASAASETAEWEALCLLIFDSSTWCTQCYYCCNCYDTESNSCFCGFFNG